jgi:hypothetical protein
LPKYLNYYQPSISFTKALTQVSHFTACSGGENPEDVFYLLFKPDFIGTEI